MGGQEAVISVNLIMETVIQHAKEKDVHKGEATGTLYRKGDSTYLKYTEVIEGAGSVNNVVKMNHEGIVILRSGSVAMRQRFLIGQTTQGMYDTPYGQLWMETTTHQMNFRWNQQSKEGDLLLKYGLVLQGEDTGSYTIKINFQEAKA
ncbi:DUF1934 domain-containing protein [Fictibacillus terranigra]|uniref:DUF1934 domain-containing protein n=1 Tax=Fictibacillus terranigra TaxID=3058424 RepID=A0ABT8E0W1_9BACL|nr:DUF1934 domain-containing protein [Fictibacillus sp. CENA-BCM004]MDN4071538.1 DUF1934 domain-containing protein [Fictibacillus sp. CENA-BCM004]